MHICADLDKLLQHQDCLQEEINLANRIVGALNLQAQQNLHVSELPEDLLRQQRVFANDLVSRLRNRKQLLMEMHEILTQAKFQMTSNTSEAIHLLDQEF